MIVLSSIIFRYPTSLKKQATAYINYYTLYLALRVQKSLIILLKADLIFAIFKFTESCINPVVMMDLNSNEHQQYRNESKQEKIKK
jgi:hypothetical protein